MSKSTSSTQQQPRPFFFAVTDIASTTSLSLSTLKNLRKRGHLGEPCRVGKRALWTAEQVDTLVAKIKAGELKDCHGPVSPSLQKKDAARAAKQVQNTATKNS